LGTAATLLDQLKDADPVTQERLRKIMSAARAVKDNVRKVGREMVGGIESSGPTPLAGKRVLVVDTDERVRKQAHVLMSRLGAGVETAASATEGLALAAGTPYDAILLDIKPGDMGGYEAYRKFRIARPSAQVALTSGFGYDSAHSIVKARADGMQHLLFKPFRQDQVINAILDDARPLGPSAAFGPS
jgi:CheY-like chemotaxis protein